MTFMLFSTAVLIAASALGSSDTIYSDTFDLTADGCPDTSLRLTTSRIRYPNTNNSVRPFGDLTRFEGIWGHGLVSRAQMEVVQLRTGVLIHLAMPEPFDLQRRGLQIHL